MGTWDEHGDTHGDHGDTVRPWGHVEAQGMDQDYGASIRATGTLIGTMGTQ